MYFIYVNYCDQIDNANIISLINLLINFDNYKDNIFNASKIFDDEF